VIDGSPRARAAERAFAVGTIAFLFNAFRPWEPLAAASSVLPGTWIARACFALALLVLMRQRRTVAVALGRVWPLLLTPALALLSAWWSAAPASTVHGALSLVGLTAFGVFLGLRFDGDEQLRVLALALGLLAGASALAALALPGYGQMTSPQHLGAWRGVFAHKNMLGHAMALAVVVSLLVAVSMPVHRPAALLGCALSAVVLWAAVSRSGELTALACVAVLGVLRVAQRRPAGRGWILGGAAAVAALGAAWLLAHAPVLLAILGRDATLTNRTYLWSVVLEAARQRPWLGYGYAAFWKAAATAPGGALERLAWAPHHAHDGLLDLGLELGVVGIVVFLGPFVVYAWRMLAWGLVRPVAWRLWPFTLLVYAVVWNAAESDLVRQHGVVWPLYVAAVVTITRPRECRRGVEATPPVPDGR
jgi:exopolysaccharide production protein ExoQ